MNSENPSEMRSLKNIFDNMHGYSYYSDHENQTANSSKEYIQHYFKLGDKGKIAAFLDEIQVDNMRYDHMKAVYMLGVWLYDHFGILRKYIDEEFKNPNQSFRCEFLYRWYLTCLFHDVGYCYGKNATHPVDFNDLYEKINEGLTGYKLLFSINDYIPQEYQGSFLKYYQFKLGQGEEGKSSIDHGIASAIKLYDILYVAHCVIEHDDTEKFRWGPDIFKSSVVPAVWYILAHNIWTAPSKTDRASEYKQHSFRGLIQSIGKSLINFEKHSMLFLLCFIDTIEPIKLLQKKDISVNIDQCLEAVKMAVDDNCIHIGFDAKEIGSNSCLGSNFHDYYLAAIVKNLNFLISHNFNIVTGNNEIVCCLGNPEDSDETQSLF